MLAGRARIHRLVELLTREERAVDLQNITDVGVDLNVRAARVEDEGWKMGRIGKLSMDERLVVSQDFVGYKHHSYVLAKRDNGDRRGGEHGKRVFGGVKLVKHRSWPCLA